MRCQCTITDKKYQQLDETVKAQLSNHSHIYPSMAAYFARANEDDSDDRRVYKPPNPKKTISKLEEAMCILIGQRNLPLAIASCPEMQSLLNHAFYLGQKNPTSRPENIIKLLGRTKFTKDFISTAQHL